MKRVILIVLDSVGCGDAPDAAEYGDESSDTLGNTSRAVGGLCQARRNCLNNVNPVGTTRQRAEDSGITTGTTERGTTGNYEDEMVIFG